MNRINRCNSNSGLTIKICGRKFAGPNLTGPTGLEETMRVIPDYVRRENPDKTTDSICVKCFRTIATGTNGSVDFSRFERNHKCTASKTDPVLFRDLQSGAFLLPIY